VIATPTDEPEGESLEPQKPPPPSGQFGLQKRDANWTIPQEAIRQALEAAKDLTSLQDLHAGLAALEKAAKDYDVAIEQLLAIAENRLRVERKIGHYLHGTVHRGRTKKNSPDARFPEQTSFDSLPKGINWSKSSRYQKLAGVPTEMFEKYLAKAKAIRKPATRRGLLREYGDRASANTSAKRSRGGKIRLVDDMSLDQIWCVIRGMMEVNVAVGVKAAQVGAPKELPSDDVRHPELSGSVVVRANDHIPEWLDALHDSRSMCKVSQAVVVFHATMREPWIQLLDHQGWTCCFVNGGIHSLTTIVAYLGERYKAVALAFAVLGGVMRGAGLVEE